MELDDGYIKCCLTHILADSHLVSDQTADKRRSDGSCGRV